MNRYRKNRDSGRYGYESSEERGESERDRPPAPREREGEDEVPAPCRSRIEKLRTIADLDGRTKAARRAHALIAELERDLGGRENLTTAQRELVQRAALIGAIVEDAEARWLAGGAANLGVYGMLVCRQRRCLEALGLERRARDVTPRRPLDQRIIDAIRSTPA